MYDFEGLGYVPFEDVISDVEKGEDALIVASGGLDSAYTLWRCHQASNGRPVKAHHIVLDGLTSTRAKSEQTALQRQIEFLGGEVELMTSSLQSPPELSFFLMKDWYCTQMLSIDMARVRGCKYLVIGDDLPTSYHRSRPDSSLNPVREKELRLLAKFTEVYSSGSVKLCVENREDDLYTLYNEMPLEYIKLTFSCREPEVDTYSSKCCGKCASCIKNKDFGFWDRVCKQLIW